MTIAHRSLIALLIGAVGLAATGCTPTPASDEWMLEPIPFQAALTGAAEAQLTKEIDVAFGMSTVASDGEGGFWSGSAGSWLHVGADGETLARFNIDVEHPLHAIGHFAARSSTELIAARSVNTPGAVPGLSIVDMETLEYTDVPVKPLLGPESEFEEVEFGDFAFGDVAVHDSAAYVVRYQPVFPASLDFEIVRIDVETGDRELLHREPFAPSEVSSVTRPGLPPVDIDVDAAGEIYVATPSYRLVLAADGSEMSRAPQSATRPVVAVRPDGLALWWGGAGEPPTASSVVVSGSTEARDLIEDRQSCDGQHWPDALTMPQNGQQVSLPFLCGANDAAWIGDSWVVATGGEGDGVLVRLTPPEELN